MFHHLAKGKSVVNQQLLELHNMKTELLQTSIQLRIQLAALRSEEVNSYLSICYRRTELDFAEALTLFTPVRETIRCQRDVVLSELMEVRLLLDHVKDQIENFEAVPEY